MSTPNPGSTKRFKDTALNKGSMWSSLPTSLQKDNLKMAAKRSVIITVFAAVLNFAGRKLVRKDLGLAKTAVKGAELFVAVGAGILVHDTLVEKRYL